MVHTTSKMCITAMFVIVYLHAFHIKCAGIFIKHLHNTFHMPCGNCSLATTIKLKRKISSGHHIVNLQSTDLLLHITSSP